ncbi:MAG: methyltransferase domain-containing protein [Rhizobiales bacterium]|nr:methyltransferase domain-containing protein [Hyphomicrobiales bacterium]
MKHVINCRPSTIGYLAEGCHSEATFQADAAQGDACDVAGYNDGSFDVVFSNSVIEHVGDRMARASFAREVQRLGRAYWVQKPCEYFPIEAHNGLPFWWFYPERLRRAFIARWKKKLPEWTEMIEGTDIVSREELQHLFPDGKIIVERFMGLRKSYIVFRNPISSAGAVDLM